MPTITLDEELKGYAIVFDSALDLIQSTKNIHDRYITNFENLKQSVRQKLENAPPDIKINKNYISSAIYTLTEPELNAIGITKKEVDQWYRFIRIKQFLFSGESPRLGRMTKSWQDVEEVLKQPWKEGYDWIQKCLDSIDRTALPIPKSKRRIRRWGENDGEISVDRMLNAEPMMYREIYKESRTGAQSVTLLANLDVQTNPNATGIYSRSVATIAATEILEEQGYNVEVYTWIGSREVYSKPYDRKFMFCRVKEAGVPIVRDFYADVCSKFGLDCFFGCFPIVEQSEQCKYGSIVDNEETCLRWATKHIQSAGKIIFCPIIYNVPQIQEAIKTILQAASSD